MKKLLLSLVAAVLLRSICGGQALPTPLRAVVYDNITSTSFVIDNRSELIRHSSVHTFCAVGTGSWSVQLQYSDIGATAGWTNFTNVSSLVTSAASSCEGAGNGYHPYIRFSITGSVAVSYRGIKDLYLFQSLGGNANPGGSSGQIQFNNAGTFFGALGTTVQPSGPIFPGLSTIYDSMRVSVNGFPITSQFGQNAVGLVEAFTGAVEIPSSANYGNHSSGVSGYARTASTSVGAVGLFGGGMLNGVAGSAWGLNTVTSNCPTLSCTSGAGSGGIIWGYELDINNFSPGANVIRGVHALGNSEVPATGLSDGFSTSVLGINKNPKIRWTNAFHSNDGSVSGASLSIGLSRISTYFVLSCTNASPMVLTLQDNVDGSTVHDLSNGDTVVIAGVLGNTNCNGTKTVTVVSPTQISIGGTGNGVYTSGGVVNLTSVQSQVISISSQNGSGVRGAASFRNDPGGNLVINPSTGAILSFSDDAFNPRILVLPTTLFPGGMVRVNSPFQFSNSAEPACAVGTRGTQDYVAGGSGVADTYRMCIKDGSDAFGYISLLGGVGGGSVFTGSTSLAPAHSATPTFSLADVSVKSPVRFEPGAMTANVASVTFTNKTPGAKFSIRWLQDGTGSRTVTYGASATDTCPVTADHDVSTTQFFEVGADGTTVNGVGCSTNGGPLFGGVEQAAPSTPISGAANCWFDSTDHTGLECMANGASTKFKMIAPTTATGNQFLTNIGTDGVQVKAQPTDANLSTSDITTNNCSTSKHGFAPKGSGVAGEFLKADCSWGTPAGGGGGGSSTVYTTTTITSSPMTILASTHGQGIKAFPYCWDSASNPQIMTTCSWSRNPTTGDLIVTYTVAPGQIDIVGALAGTYVIPSITSSPMTILASTHGQGAYAFGDCYDASYVRMSCSWTSSATGDLVMTYTTAPSHVYIHR